MLRGAGGALVYLFFLRVFCLSICAFSSCRFRKNSRILRVVFRPPSRSTGHDRLRWLLWLTSVAVVQAVGYMPKYTCMHVCQYTAAVA